MGKWKTSLIALMLVLPLVLAGCGDRQQEPGTTTTAGPEINQSGAEWEVDYDIDETEDVIAMHNQVSNWEKLDSFAQQKKGTLRIVHYTIEGDPIFYDLKSGEGDRAFQLRYDTTKDKFGSPHVSVTGCKGLQKEETETELVYKLTECDGESDTIDVLTIDYNVSEQDLFEFSLLYGIGKKNEIHTAEQKVVKDLIIDGVAELSNFKLTEKDRGYIYKKLVLSNYLGEKELSNECNMVPHASYELTVLINGGSRHFEWSACDSAKDNETMTAIAQEIIGIVESKAAYKKLPEPNGAYE